MVKKSLPGIGEEIKEWVIRVAANPVDVRRFALCPTVTMYPTEVERGWAHVIGTQIIDQPSRRPGINLLLSLNKLHQHLDPGGVGQGVGST